MKRNTPFRQARTIGFVLIMFFVAVTAQAWTRFLEFTLQVDNREKLRIYSNGNWELLGDDSRNPFGLCDGNTKSGLAYACMTQYAAFPTPGSLDFSLTKWNAQVVAGKSPRCPNVAEGSNPGNTISVIQHTENELVIYFRDDGDCGSSGRVTCTVRLDYQEPTRPQIFQSPVALVVRQGQRAEFSVIASGGNLNYQWRRNGVAIPGSAASTFVIPTTSTRDAGVYDVVVSNGLGNTTSGPAGLQVVAAPVALSVKKISADWIEVSWTSSANERYLLQLSEDFLNWSSNGNVLTGNGGRIAVKLPLITGHTEFYRLQIEP